MEALAVKIQACIRSKDIRRAAKKMKNAITNQAYRLSTIKYFSNFIENDDCYMLVVGSEDSEIRASFSQYSMKRATLKVRHIVDTLRAMVVATENGESITWIGCCQKSIELSFNQIKRARTKTDWCLDLYARDKL